MKGLAVFRWLTPVALAVFFSDPVQTANAFGMGGGHIGGGGGHMGGGMGGHMGGIGGRGHPMMGTRFFNRNGTSSFAQGRDPAFGNRFVNQGNRFFDRGCRFGNARFGRAGRFAGRERFEREEHKFFENHNFFVGFDFAAFGWWPWWGWDSDWWYPYPDDAYYPYYDYDYGYGYPYYSGYGYGDRQTNGSQYGAEYWNNLATSVQTKLADQRYYHGQIDGVIGPGTMEAVRRFQADHGLKVTGKIDPKLLRSLGVSYKAPPQQA